MISHKTKLRVRYSETDQMGYVYYGQYAAYFEVARVEAMRSVGLQYASLERDHGILMPVMNVQMRFIRPAKYDEELTLVTEIRKMPDMEIVFHTEVFGESGKLATAGRVTLCVLEADSHKRIPVPAFIREIMQDHFD